MSATARELVLAIGRLPDADREAVIAELITRYPVEDGGDIPDDTYTALADELFQAYDAAEAGDAAPPR